MTLFLDKSVVAGTRRRESDGMLVADVRVARTGVQLYRGSEVDKDNEHGFRDASIVRVYRPREEVFAKDTLESVAHRPVTNDHPSEMRVDSKNWKNVAVGNTGGDVSTEDIYIRVPLIISDESTIQQIEGGKREVSAGYTSILDWTPGKSPDGDDYDAVQRSIRFNHVAVVSRGRAGSAVRIGDAASPIEDGEEGEDTMADKPLKTVTVDGLSIETTDQGAQVIEKLQSQISKLIADAAAAEQTHRTAIADKDRELAKKDASIDELRKQVLDAASLDKIVAERSKVIADAKMVHKDIKVDGVSTADIRREAVRHVIGDAALVGKSQDYIDARFDVLVESAGKSDSFRSVVADGAKTVAGSSDEANSAYKQMIADMQSASIPATAKAN